MKKSIRINYIELPARDFNATQAFYEKAFGWQFIDYGEDYRAFNDGQFDGGFYRSDQHSSCENGAALVVLKAKHLEEKRDAIVAAGGTLIKAIFAFPGGRRFHFTDPNGNELAVWSES